MKALASMVGIVIAGCAATPGVAPTGPDSFMVSRQAATGFSGIGNLKQETLREAGEFCASRSQHLRVISTSESQPPYVLGNYPRVEVNFMCLASGDRDLTRPALEPIPNTVIKVK